MIRGAIFVAMLGMLCGITSAGAQSFLPSGKQKVFSFDAQDGRFRQWNTDITCSLNAIRGTVHFRRYGTRASQWVPGVKIFVRHGPNGDASAVSLDFHALDYAPPFHVTIGRATDQNGQLNIVPFDVAPGSDFSFLIYWNSGGLVTAIVDGEQHSLAIGEAPDNLLINGFSGAGDIEFELGEYRLPDDAGYKPIA